MGKKSNIPTADDPNQDLHLFMQSQQLCIILIGSKSVHAQSSDEKSSFGGTPKEMPVSSSLQDILLC